MEQAKTSRIQLKYRNKYAQVDLILTLGLLLLLLSMSVFTAGWWRGNITRMAWLFLDTGLQTGIALLVMSPLLLHKAFEGRRVFWFGIAAAATIALDLDHFAAAGSFAIEDAINLDTRPVSHSFIFALMGGMAAWLLSRKWMAGLLISGVLTAHLFHDMYDHGVYFFWPLSDQLITSPTILFIFSQVTLLLLAAIAAAWSTRPFWRQGILRLLLYMRQEIHPQED